MHRQWRMKTAALRDFAAGERKRAHGASMKAAQEGDEFIAASGIAGQLDGCFDRFGARIAEIHAPRHATGR